MKAGKFTAVLLLCSSIFALPLAGEDRDAGVPPGNLENAEVLLDEALAAEEAEFWERAMDLYRRGTELHPGDVRFPWALGNLYRSRGLYSLAWEEYRRAEKLEPRTPELLYSLARTAGYLNKNTLAVDYLERLLTIDPGHRDAIGQLGWMYYKVHRQADGVRLLEAAIEHFEEDPDFAMTLGTLNADMFRYNEGKRWYLNAITGAEQRQDSLFASVAHYNLSILESRFYHFDQALEQTNASLGNLNRSSGRLARGELYLRQLEFRSALADYEAAYEMDTSPLSRLNLAQVYQISGRLEEARAYAEDCLRGGDFSWMLNYGIDPVRYLRDIHEILYKTYEGLGNTEGLRPYPAPGEWIRSGARGLSYRFKAEVHRLLFRKYSRASAASYEEPHPEALIQYYRAFEAYPRRALDYLREARSFEIPLIPAAEPGYDYEEGQLMNRRSLVAASLQGFDLLWERDMIADGLAELAKKARAGDPGFAEELYLLNPGALRQQGIGLRVRYSFDGAVPPPRRLRGLTGMLRKAGLRAGDSRNTGDSPGPRLSLNLRFTEAGDSWAVSCVLSGEGRSLVSRDILLASPSRRDAAAFARELADAVFIR
ncbi:MAG: tetratricopeptide repeat protein [Treponema sp.]|nr:tetratricopeptide repeat protein [Treponema sp.]